MTSWWYIKVWWRQKCRFQKPDKYRLKTRTIKAWKPIYWKAPRFAGVTFLEKCNEQVKTYGQMGLGERKAKSTWHKTQNSYCIDNNQYDVDIPGWKSLQCFMAETKASLKKEVIFDWLTYAFLLVLVRLHNDIFHLILKFHACLV